MLCQLNSCLGLVYRTYQPKETERSRLRRLHRGRNPRYNDIGRIEPPPCSKSTRSVSSSAAPYLAAYTLFYISESAAILCLIQQHHPPLLSHDLVCLFPQLDPQLPAVESVSLFVPARLVHTGSHSSPASHLPAPTTPSADLVSSCNPSAKSPSPGQATSAPPRLPGTTGPGSAREG
jgi:hypothetical protein